MWFQKLTDDDRIFFRDACLRSTHLKKLYDLAFMNWAVLHNPPVWEMETLPICYRTSIKTSLISDLCMVENGIWYVRTDKWMTAREFRFEHCQTIDQHAEDHVEYEIKRVELLKKLLKSPVCTRTVFIAVNDTVLKVKRTGPVVVHPEEWAYKPGEQYIALDE